MRITLYVNDEQPGVAAAILRHRAMLRLSGFVYVRAHKRLWPGGLKAALKADAKRRVLKFNFRGVRPDPVLTKVMRRSRA